MSEFIAELPADLGELSLMKTKPLEPHSFGQASSYQAFQPSLAQSGSPSSGFAIPRRDVSTNSVPFTDPWRFADPVTELPTREFYALADLLFDALDKKFEPKNTGMLEAPKVIGSWVDLSEDASREWKHCVEDIQPVLTNSQVSMHTNPTALWLRCGPLKAYRT